MQFLWFLWHLHKRSWVIATLIWTFVFFQCYYTYKIRAVFPFINWGMFSNMAPNKDLHHEYLIVANGKVLHFNELSIWQYNIMLSKLDYYRRWQENGKADYWKSYIQPEFHFDKNSKTEDWLENRLCNSNKIVYEFESWLSLFLKNAVGKNINELKVYYNIYQYDNNTVSLTNAQLLISYHDGK